MNLKAIDSAGFYLGQMSKSSEFFLQEKVKGGVEGWISSSFIFTNETNVYKRVTAEDSEAQSITKPKQEQRM